MSQARLRFAPSPTGYLHVGGARTALYNWLYARKQNGVFVLRIEDTDVQRSSQEMVDVILNSLQWLGLNWDEGPYFQSRRFDLYRNTAHKLVQQGKAYRCFCKPEELNARRDAAVKVKGSWKYERICYALSNDQIEQKIAAGEPYAIRFLVAEGRTSFHDLVHGEISLANEQVDDFVLLRSDAFPTYHLSVVVDDIDMKITQVIRGDDHISNTPKQIMLYAALGAIPPEFGHLPLILGPDKKRLSKRHGSVAVEEYRNQGILPEALDNFLALLGWSPGDDREIMNMLELTKEFNLARVNSSNAVFDLKKLQWMNGKYLSSIPLDRVLLLLDPFLPDANWKNRPDFSRWVDLLRTRATTLSELAAILGPFMQEEFPYDTAGMEKAKKDPNGLQLLKEFVPTLDQVQTWDHKTLEAHLRAFAESHSIKPAALIHPIRLGISGKTAGPGLFELIELTGKDKTIARLNRFLQQL